LIKNVEKITQKKRCKKT